MLSSAPVGQQLDAMADRPGLTACAVLTLNGNVLESRENFTKPETGASHGPGDPDVYGPSPKLQTRICALFASSAWRDKVKEAIWVGLETSEYRIAITPVGKLLCLVVAASPSHDESSETANGQEIKNLAGPVLPWGVLRATVLELSASLADSVGDFDPIE